MMSIPRLSIDSTVAIAPANGPMMTRTVAPARISTRSSARSGA
jgi:hypothetical protein